MTHPLSAEEVAQFHRDGFVIRRGLLDQEERDLVRAKADLDHHYIERAHETKDVSGTHTRISLWDYPGDDLYGAISRSKRLAGSASAILDDEVYHWHSKITMKDPGKGAWEWHQDYGYWYNQCLFPDLVSCYIAIDPATKENGCLQVLKHSHRMGRVNHELVGTQTGCEPTRLKESLEHNFEKIYVELDAGDAVFFHCNMFHRSDLNNSDKPRWGLICCYNSKHNRPVREGHPDYNKLDILDDHMVKEIGQKDIAALQSA